MKLPRKPDGTLAAYTLTGQPIVYRTDDGDELCQVCAKRSLQDCEAPRLIGYDVLKEKRGQGNVRQCTVCWKPINMALRYAIARR